MDAMSLRKREAMFLFEVVREMVRRRLYREAVFVLRHFPTLLSLRLNSAAGSNAGEEVSPYLYVMQ